LANAHELLRKHCTAHFAVSAATLTEALQCRELAGLRHFHPTLNEELGVKSAAALTIQLLKLLANPDGRIAAGIKSCLVIDAFYGMAQGSVESLKGVKGLVELAAKGINGLRVLQLGPPDASKELRFARC
jgi:hypothetical protein